LCYFCGRVGGRRVSVAGHRCAQGYSYRRQSSCSNAQMHLVCGTRLFRRRDCRAPRASGWLGAPPSNGLGTLAKYHYLLNAHHYSFSPLPRFLFPLPPASYSFLPYLTCPSLLSLSHCHTLILFISIPALARFHPPVCLARLLCPVSVRTGVWGCEGGAGARAGDTCTWFFEDVQKRVVVLVQCLDFG
jgi:hypothetical protein